MHHLIEHDLICRSLSHLIPNNIEKGSSILRNSLSITSWIAKNTGAKCRQRMHITNCALFAIMPIDVQVWSVTQAWHELVSPELSPTNPSKSHDTQDHGSRQATSRPDISCFPSQFWIMFRCLLLAHASTFRASFLDAYACNVDKYASFETVDSEWSENLDCRSIVISASNHPLLGAHAMIITQKHKRVKRNITFAAAYYAKKFPTHCLCSP